MWVEDLLTSFHIIELRESSIEVHGVMLEADPFRVSIRPNLCTLPGLGFVIKVGEPTKFVYTSLFAYDGIAVRHL